MAFVVEGSGQIVLDLNRVIIATVSNVLFNIVGFSTAKVVAIRVVIAGLPFIIASTCQYYLDRNIRTGGALWLKGIGSFRFSNC